MSPSVKGDLWPLFHREETLSYVGTAVYARCKACTLELSLAAGSAVREQLKGDKAAVAAGRVAAKLHGLVVGRYRNMYSHVLNLQSHFHRREGKAEE
jgi:hypothetical protein